LFKFFSHNLIQKINVKIKIKIIIKIKKYIIAFCNGTCVIHLKFIILTNLTPILQVEKEV